MLSQRGRGLCSRAGLGLGSVGQWQERAPQRPGQCCGVGGGSREAPGELGPCGGKRTVWSSLTEQLKLQREMGRGVVCDRSPSGGSEVILGVVFTGTHHLLPTPTPPLGSGSPCSGQKWLLRSVAMGIKCGKESARMDTRHCFLSKEIASKNCIQIFIFGNMCLTVGFPCYLFPIFGCSWTGVVCGFQGWGAEGYGWGVSSHRPFLALPF